MKVDGPNAVHFGPDSQKWKIACVEKLRLFPCQHLRVLSCRTKDIFQWEVEDVNLDSQDQYKSHRQSHDLERSRILLLMSGYHL